MPEEDDFDLCMYTIDPYHSQSILSTFGGPIYTAIMRLSAIHYSTHLTASDDVHTTLLPFFSFPQTSL